MSNEDLIKRLNDLETQMRNMRIQVALLGLKDTKQKHPRVVQLEKTLHNLLHETPRRNFLIDDCLEELEILVNIKPEHHKIAQGSN